MLGVPDRKRWQHRICPPQSTCDRLEPLLPRFGITRVADITGLDFLGIPVFQSVRPMGKSLSVSQGKGTSATAARASAMMEAVEVWHAENETLDRLRSSSKGLADARRITPDLLRRRGVGPVSDYVPIDWTPALDLSDGADILVPSEAANLDFTRDADPPDLARSSTGLAGGNTREEARASALAEVIERACHMDFLRLDHVAQAARRIAPAALVGSEPRLDTLLNLVRASGLSLDLYDMTNRFEVTAIRAVLYATEAGQPQNWPSLGHGAHLDPITAVIRAITEAAQSRLTGISGNRDDISPTHFDTAAVPNMLREIRQKMDLGPADKGLDRADDSTQSPAEDAARLIERILAQKAGPVAEVDLSRADIGVPIVKMLAPNVAYLASP